jgi:5'-nucleotidase
VDVDKPLILVVNDDGIQSRGLWAAAEAVLPLGDVIVVAPDRQWSGGGRCMPPDVTGCLEDASRYIGGTFVQAFAVDASPALAVGHGITELCPRMPDLVVSGINSGANLSIEVTISGTVGAALEGAAFGVPALAVSLEMDPKYHLSGDARADYGTAMAHTRRFAQRLLTTPLPSDVAALNLNIPADVPIDTPWRLTRLSRQRYFTPTAPDRSTGSGRPGYRVLEDLSGVAPDSDVWAIMADRVVSVTPLSLDLTSRGAMEALMTTLGPTTSVHCSDSPSFGAEADHGLSVPTSHAQQAAS